MFKKVLNFLFKKRNVTVDVNPSFLYANNELSEKEFLYYNNLYAINNSF